MCHTYGFGLRILNYASWVLGDAIFGSRSNYYTCFPSRILTNWSVSGLEILANDSFFLLVLLRVLSDVAH